MKTLHEKYGADLEIIALPCDQFGGQELGTDAARSPHALIVDDLLLFRQVPQATMGAVEKRAACEALRSSRAASAPGVEVDAVRGRLLLVGMAGLRLPDVAPREVVSRVRPRLRLRRRTQARGVVLVLLSVCDRHAIYLLIAPRGFRTAGGGGPSVLGIPCGSGTCSRWTA